jgi:L-fuconolactonase
MRKIDAHQHFWKYDPVKDNWITGEMAIIRRDFLPADLAPVLKENGFDGCVAVQAGQSENESRFLLGLAGEYDFIKGVVGWVDLRSTDIESNLEWYKGFEKLKGFRHILQGESRRDIMLSAEFKRGIAALQKYGFTYDILVFNDQLQYLNDFVSAFPGQRFVIDHLGKPNIKSKETAHWKKYISGLAAYPNVFCKISGFVTEADWAKWNKEDFYPYFDHLVNSFGIDRLMFGSDWPVCLLAAEYKAVLNIIKEYFSSFSKDEQDKLFGLNAIQFYNL